MNIRKSNSRITTEILNRILNRNSMIEEISTILKDFESNCHNLNYKKGIYIYGSPASYFTISYCKYSNT